MQKLLKKFEIEEYGTNFTKDVYDPKKIGDDSVVDDKKVLRPTVPNVINIYILISRVLHIPIDE